MFYGCFMDVFMFFSLLPIWFQPHKTRPDVVQIPARRLRDGEELAVKTVDLRRLCIMVGRGTRLGPRDIEKLGFP